MSVALSRKRVIKNSFSQLLTFALSGGSKAIAAIMVARTLGPGGMGTFSLSWTLAGTLAFVAVLGLDNRLIRELARARDASELERSLPLACILGVVFGGLLTAIPALTGVHSDAAQALAAAGGFVAISAPILIFRASFHAREKMELETAACVVEGAVALIAVGLALNAGFGVGGAMLGLTAGRAANLLLCVVFYRRLWGPVRFRMDVTHWFSLVREGWPLAVSYSLTATYLRFDILILAIFHPSTEVGMYGAASVILLTAPLVAVSFSSSLYPILAQSDGIEDGHLRRVFQQTTRILLVAALPLATGLTLLSESIAELLFGAGFGDTGKYLALLAWVLPFRFVNHLFGVVLAATDRRSKRVAAVALALAANLVLNLLLIPSWGAYGAVIATVATELVIAGILLWGIRPLRPYVVRPLVEGAAVSLALAAVVLSTPGGVIVQLMTGGVVFFVGLATIFLWLPGRASAGPPAVDPKPSPAA
ncbi:MAG: flippase [Actinobacteria bacterium]|nr:flippase [Actinomycetota bacterium]